MAQRFALLALGHAVKLKPVIDQLEAQLLGDAALQLFDVLVAEFDHPARLHIDQVIVMGFRRLPRSASGRRGNHGAPECRHPRTA